MKLSEVWSALGSTLAILFIGGGIVLGYPWVGTAFFVLVLGSLLVQGYKRIPASPPHLGILTIRGERQSARSGDTIALKEGIVFLPLRGFWYDTINVKVERETLQVSAQVFTPDNVQSTVSVVLTWRPVEQLLSNYLNSRAKEGVEEALRGKVAERLREWARNRREGPRTWEEFMASRLEGVSVLLKAIASSYVTSVPEWAQEVPTYVWLEYFSAPRPTADEVASETVKQWANNNWERIERILQSHSAEEITELKGAVKGRREEIASVRQGLGRIIISDLGVRLERLNIDEVDPDKEVAGDAKLATREELQRKGELVEARLFRDAVMLIRDALGVSAEQAIEVIQTERKKVPKSISETKVNVSEETRRTLENLLLGIFRRHP